MDRVILHCDMNGFFASVELLSHPELREVPMAVCGDVENRHGIILAKNEPAKKLGIRTAETVWQAQQKCPCLHLIPPHHEKYLEYSKKANEIYQSFTDLVEPFGIDESWLDVTGSNSLFGSGNEIADALRKRLKSELNLTASVGVSFNKIFAKLGSDYRKPDATTIVSRENFQSIIWPLPVGNMLFVGKNTENTLLNMNISSIGDLAMADEKRLEAKLGKHGRMLSTYARGLDTTPVRRFDSPEPVKSIGNQITFKRNLIGFDDIRKGVLALSDSVATRLRAQKLKCGGVQIAIKDPSFHSIDRQMQLPRATHLTKDIFSASIELIEKAWNPDDPIRLLSVTGIQLVDENSDEQMTLFQTYENNERLEAFESSVDEIKRKFGADVLSRASMLKNDLGI